jgi:hypothetical protein
MENTDKLIKQLIKDNKELNKKVEMLLKEIDMLKKTSKQDIHYHFHNDNQIPQPYITPFIPEPYNPYPYYGYPTTICDDIITNIGVQNDMSSIPSNSNKISTSYSLN